MRQILIYQNAVMLKLSFAIIIVIIYNSLNWETPMGGYNKKILGISDITFDLLSGPLKKVVLCQSFCEMRVF